MTSGLLAGYLAAVFVVPGVRGMVGRRNVRQVEP